MTVWSPDDVAAAQGGETDSAVFALAGDLPGIHGAVGELRTLRLGDHFAKLEGGAGRCVDLHAVMHFENFDVVSGVQRLCGQLQQFEHRADAERVVGENTIGIFRAASAIFALAPSSRPVVPITMATPCVTQASR